MNMQQRLLGFLVIIGLVIASSKVAIANHYDYLPQDPAYYNWVAGGDPEMWTYQTWYLNSIFYPKSSADPWRVINWKADSAIRTPFGQAVSDWSSIDNQLGIDWHPWRDINNTSGYVQHILNGVVGACPGSPSATGCLSPTIWSGVSPGHANFINVANIYMNFSSSYTWSNDVKRAAIAHEIGHAYGLHERYIEGPPIQCNNNESTVMDALYADANSVVHQCDNVSGPTATDRARISNFYLGGNYVLQNAWWDAATGFQSRWTDQTWSDWGLNLDYYQWNGTYWVIKGTMTELVDIAAHQTPANRTIASVYNVKSAWGSGWYFVCGKGWNGTKDNGTKVFGFGSCSGQIYVP